MVQDTLKALLQRNAELAQHVIKQDQEVDELQQKIYRNLLSDMIRDPQTIERATSLLLISLKIERMADHATNICEDIIYLVTGVTVRHKGKF